MQEENRPFCPFKKTIEDLATGDLACLREIAEGWYVEYKCEAVGPERIAKSVSSFANQYGGWLFFGIASRNDNTAGAFPGVPNEDLPSLLQRIQNGISAHVDPTPWFEVKTLGGPLDEIGLPDNKSVVAVWVPAGRYTPYVHSTGRIYRRVGDASDPDPTRSRGELAELWERGRRNRDEIEDLLWPPDPPAVRNYPRMRLALASDRLGDAYGHKNVDEPAFMEALRTTPGGLNFDTFFPNGGGIVAQTRRANHAVPHERLPTWLFLPNRLLSGFSVGLSAAPARQVGSFLDSRRLGKAYREECVRQGLGDVQVFDLDDLWVTVSAAIVLQRKLQATAGVEGPVFVRLALSNIRGWAPFLGSDGYQDQVRARGVPLVQTRTVRFGRWLPATDEAAGDAAAAALPVAVYLSGYAVFGAICHLSGVSGGAIEAALRDGWIRESLERAWSHASRLQAP